MKQVKRHFSFLCASVQCAGPPPGCNIGSEALDPTMTDIAGAWEWRWCCYEEERAELWARQYSNTLSN